MYYNLYVVVFLDLKKIKKNRKHFNSIERQFFTKRDHHFFKWDEHTIVSEYFAAYVREALLRVLNVR